MKIKKVIEYLDECFPSENASDFDVGKIGLTIGDENIDLKNIILTLDLNYEVVCEAIENDVNLIISHHPFLFNPITKIHFNSEKGKIIRLMFKHNLSLYSMHTNFDVGKNGINDTLAKILDLKNIVGKVEKDEFLRYGEINSLPLKEFVELVKKRFNLNSVRVVGDLNKRVNKVGIVGGSGSDEVFNALKVGCDCLITGEVKLHLAQYASYHGLALIEVNHGVEKIGLKTIRKELEKRLQGKKKVYITKINTDPLINI